MRNLMIASLCLTLSGCVVSELQTAATSARYVGDTTYAQSRDTVVTIAVGSKQIEYHNLHVGMSAMVQKKPGFTLAQASDVCEMLQRLEPRIAAHIVEVASVAHLKVPGQLGSIREAIRCGAQRIVDERFLKWQHAKNFQVEINVTSLYLTELQIPVQNNERVWWTYK